METKIKLPDQLRKPSQFALREAERLYREQPELPSTYTGISRQRQAGLDRIYNTAVGGSGIPEAATEEYLRTIRGDYLHPESNPYLRAVAQESAAAAAAPVLGTFAGGGRFGSGAMHNAAQSAAQATAQRIYAGNYQQERDRVARAVSQAPEMDALQYVDANRMMAVGDAYEADEQARQAEAMRQYMYPHQRLGFFERSLAGSPLNAAVTQSTTGDFDWAGFGMTLGGAALGGVLGGAPGAMMGAQMGGQLGGASQRG